ncbi:MAG TPA: acyl-CoA dehydrogenase family protein [Vineibacter sp.]|nr:acyl-CoA dehydrogenase family protein [Vineibacter sp.]
MPTTTAAGWTPSATLPKERVSFADVGYAEMLERARQLVPVLAKRAAECEALRRLPESTERDLHRTGLFRMVQPKRVGGAELDVGIFVDTCAELARVCPSTAWNLGNLASHHWMLGFFPPETQDELWDVSLDVLIATSLAFPAGRGRKVDGGYEVSGRWPLSSGVDNSDWNMLAYMVRETPDGPPVDQRFALVHRSQYEIIDNWHAVGLAGTGSKDVAIKGLFVPANRTLTAWALNGKPHPGSSVNSTPLFRVPMLALGPYVLSGVMLGCAQGAYETTVGAARRRNATTTGQPVGASQTVQIKVAEAGARIDAAEIVMRRACEHAMAVARSGAEPAHADKVRYRRDAFFSVRLCLEAVDILMGIAGSSGLYLSNAMQRLFRDAHAANAHIMFSPDVQGAIFGQHALGAAGPPPLL